MIIDTTPDRPRVLGEVDLFSAQVLVHEHAIYIHESVQYHVDRLEWGERKAYVHKIDVDHYTYANRAVTLKPLDVFAEAPATGGRRVHGEVMVASLVTLYKKLKFLTDENVGWGPIDLPELELQTTAYWLTAEGAAAAGDGDELDVALLGRRPGDPDRRRVLLMVDPRDLGLVTQVRSPHPEAPTIYLYEAVPGGVGLSERLWERHDELLAGAADLIAALRLRGGLSGLHGPRLEPDVDAKALALRLLADLGAAVARGARRGSGGRPPMIDGGTALARRLERYRRRRRGRPLGAIRPRLRARSTSRRAAGGRARRRGRPDGRGDRSSASSAPVAAARRSIASGSRRCPASRRRTSRSSASTRRRPGSPRRPGRSAFLIGLGWWEGDRFRQVQLLLPDHAEEPALLDRARGAHPGGRLAGDLQRPRLRLAAARRPLPAGPPGGAGPRRPPRPAADRPPRSSATGWPMRGCGRRRRSCSGSTGYGDVDGWEIPGRYLGFLRGGPAEPLVDVVRHNDEDVRSLARLLAHLERGYADAGSAGREAPPGDLAGLARAFARERRLDEALACLDAAADSATDDGARAERRPAGRARGMSIIGRRPAPRTSRGGRHGGPPDFGGRPRRPTPESTRRPGAPPVQAPWTVERIAVDRAHLLRRLGRLRGGSRRRGRRSRPGRAAVAIVAWIELAKLARAPPRATAPRRLASRSAASAARDRRRRLGCPEPALEADLRRSTLRRRLAAPASRRGGPSSGTIQGRRGRATPTWLARSARPPAGPAPARGGR